MRAFQRRLRPSPLAGRCRADPRRASSVGHSRLGVKQTTYRSAIILHRLGKPPAKIPQLRRNPWVSDERYNPKYLEGVEFFNECEFFEAHEAWEELWTEYQGPSRKFYQGLIQVAVCLHHFGNGNLRGAAKLYHSSRAYLEPYLPAHEGVDLEQLLRQLQVCCERVLETDQAELATAAFEIDPELIPEIHLNPSLDAG